MTDLLAILTSQMPAIVAAASARQPILNFSRRKVGGIWFLKLGRLNLSFSVSR